MFCLHKKSISVDSVWWFCENIAVVQNITKNTEGVIQT